MKFSNTDVVELPKSNLSFDLKAELICNPGSIDGIITGHTSSAVSQDLSNFARHLSFKAKNFLAKMGLRRITASLFVSAASQYFADGCGVQTQNSYKWRKSTISRNEKLL